MQNINQSVENQIKEIEKACKAMPPVVVIHCYTYNHEHYIKETLEGFINQKTNFHFVAIIHDDASTDNTASIIKDYANKYPDIIKPIYEIENQYSKGDGSLGKVMNIASDLTQSKYIALCEGDDYWTDPYKLQIQVDFLESHSDYGLCYTKVKRLDQRKSRFIDIWGGPGETFMSFLQSNTIPTLSVVYRRDLRSCYVQEINPYIHNWMMGDYPMWLYFASKSKIKFLDCVTGVYRKLPESASHSNSINKIYNFRKNYYEIKDYFIKISNAKEINQKTHINLEKAKYTELLPFAITLKDISFIKEVEDFYKYNSKNFKVYFFLKFPVLTSYIVKYKYEKK